MRAHHWLGLALLPLVACRDAPRPNAIVVLVDTLRADRLGLYGYERHTSPALERFAERAVVFENALAQSACTYPSVNSLLTSRYPARFDSRRTGSFGIPADVPALPEILRSEGYATAAVSASMIVRKTPSPINPGGGFDRGFELFDESCANGPAECVNRRALDLARELPEPFLLYLHYMDPHAPYAAPEESGARFASGSSRNAWIRRGYPRPIRDHLYAGKPAGYDEADVALLRDRYDEEIGYFDESFGRLLDELARSGLLDRSVLLLASDHGEEFLEHGEMSHCRDIAYQTVLRTPLLLLAPGVPGGRRSAKVQNLDVVPTLLHYLGIDASGYAFEGKSLAPVVAEDREVHDHVFASQGVSRVVSDGRFKLIYSLDTQDVEVYDLEADPGETRDVSSIRGDVAAPLLQALRGWVEGQEGGVDRRDRVRRAKETEEQLRALGYL